jgi:hypothetical protein
MARLTPKEQQAVHRETLRLNSKAWGVATGLLGGITLFIATIVLVLQGGENVGQHLGLLANYLPGYRVTFLGACLGFVYMFVLGYALGRLIGYVYNWGATPRP